MDPDKMAPLRLLKPQLQSQAMDKGRKMASINSRTKLHKSYSQRIKCGSFLDHSDPICLLNSRRNKPFRSI